MFNFINAVMDRAYYVFLGFVPPIISLELRTSLQLSPDTKKRDCYLFENHTILRICGFENDPYLLLSFFTPRIYALEFIKQRFAADYENFAKHKKSITFKLPYEIGPFIARRRTTKTIAKDLLKETKFQKGEKINYYAHHIISKKSKIFFFLHMSTNQTQKWKWQQIQKVGRKLSKL